MDRDGLFVILFMCVCVALIVYSVKKKKPEVFVNFTLRTCGGLIAIYLCNYILKQFALDLLVGMNGFSALTVGALGTPGFLLLYGIMLYCHLK